jgi:NAD(P)-dependent dehydrogenase (short-subunit alcohol dehydrogenase family)
MDSKAPRPLAIVTGASSDIGLELTRCAARHGYDILAAADTMFKGEADVVAGLKNKLTVAMSKLTPSQVLAEKHRTLAEPGSASQT